MLFLYDLYSMNTNLVKDYNSFLHINIKIEKNKILRLMLLGHY